MKFKIITFKAKYLIKKLIYLKGRKNYEFFVFLKKFFIKAQIFNISAKKIINHDSETVKSYLLIF